MPIAPPPAHGLVPAHVTQIARVTGRTPSGETLPNPNQTDRKDQVFGTDLGILWQSGPQELMIAFGDTYGEQWGGSGSGPESADWRSNVLALANVSDPEHGLVFTTMLQDAHGHAKELIPSQKQAPEITTIPTGGVTVGNRHYLYYMSVSHWGAPGVWQTNFASIAYSDDHGQSWTTMPHALWPNNAQGDSHFQQLAVAKQGDAIALLGTPAGRFGGVTLARVDPYRLLEPTAYEYWDGHAWRAGDEGAAVPILPGPAGEVSAAYSAFFQRWIVLYLNEWKRAIVLRDAAALTGPWTEEKTLVTYLDRPGLYGGFLDPSHMDGLDIYFTLSQWDPYNVFWMRATLEQSVP